MLLYLAGNTRPDIAFVVHQCAWFSHQPNKCHEDTLKRIVWYLKGAFEKGLIFKPTGELTLEAFVDANFVGLWGVGEPQDATCVKSRMGYVIRLGGSLLVWKTGCSVNNGGRVCCSFSMHEGIDSSATFIVGIAKCIFV